MPLLVYLFRFFPPPSLFFYFFFTFFAHNFSHLNLMLVLGCFSISDASVVLLLVVAGASKNNNEAFPVDRRVCLCVCVQVFCGLNSLVCVNLF